MLSNSWHIQLLGGLAATRNNERIDLFRSRKSAVLLAYLAMYNRAPASRERLADMLWPDEDAETARNRLRVILTGLRRQLEPSPMESGSVIQANRSSIWLVEDSITTDVEIFRLSVAHAARMEDGHARADALLEAFETYRGELLPEFYEEWIATERRALEQVYHETAIAGIGLICDSGKAAETLSIALRLAANDPLDEEAQCLLMRVYSDLGQPGKANDVFEGLTARLKEEFNSQPSVGTTEFVAVLRAGKQGPSRRRHTPHTVAQPAEAAVIKSELPHATSSFHGRQSDLARLELLLSPHGSHEVNASGRSRLITLIGFGGIGKTRLALQAARLCESRFTGGAWFVPLADVADLAQMVQGMADSLRIRLLPHRNALDQVVDELRDHAEDGPLLLVLDSLEQLPGAARDVVELLLSRVAEVWILATSRRLVGLPTEYEYHVEPLDLPIAAGDIELMLTSGSVSLFAARAQATRPDFRLTERNAQAVSELCRKLDGIPLAIELAAARIRLLTPSQMIQEMDQRFDLLVNLRATKDSRHRSLRVALERSVQMLPGPVKEFFALLSVFHGSCNLESARAVSRDPGALDKLDHLASYSLVQTFEREKEMRYSMLDTVRQYAASLLTPEEKEQLRAEHARLCAEWIYVCERDALNADRTRISARHELEKDNIRAAWVWALKNDVAMALEIAANLRWVFFLQYRLREGEEMILQTLRAAGAEHTHAAARARVTLGMLLCYMDDFAGAKEPLQTATAQLGPDQDREKRLVLAFTGWVTMHEGDFDRALSLLENARQQFAVAGDRWNEAGSMNLMGFAACYGRRFDLAREMLTRSRDLFLEIGDAASSAHCPLGLARVEWMRGNLAAAEEQYLTSLSDFRQYHDQRGSAYSIEGLARIASERGNHYEAVRLTAAAQRIRDQIALRRDPPDQAAYEAVMSSASAALEEAIVKAAWDEGRQMGEVVADTAIPPIWDGV